MTRNLQGLFDEFCSAGIAIAALRDALALATRFERAGIERALREALRTYRRIGFELMDAMEAEIDDAMSPMQEAA